MFVKKMQSTLIQLLSRLVATAAVVLFVSIGAQAELSIIPAPVFAQELEGAYTLDQQFTVSYSQGADEVAKYLVEVTAPALGFAPSIEEATEAPEKGVFLQLSAEPILYEGVALNDEGYTLDAGANGVTIRANHTTGLFYGVQSLRQLMPAEIFAASKQSVQWQLPYVSIIDQPRFEWRGMHLDVARHFMPLDFVKKFVDLLAMHKMNRFHWHLTDDQGWRIEIKQYPRLTEIGAWRDETMMGHYSDKPWWDWLMFWRPAKHQYDGTPYGGFYTQDEVKELVAYARQRHIMVVPEIELPGHAQAAIVAYPELASSDEKIGVKREWGVSHYIFSPEESTIYFLKNMLSEVMEMFPSEYIHIGGDEADKHLWDNSTRVQALIKKRGLKDEDEMQSWFIKQLDVFLAEHGRRLIGWDEILEGGLAEGATVMSWRGEEGGIAAAKSGHDAVMATVQYTYFDYYQSKSKDEPLAIGGFLPLEKVYEYNPIPSALNEQESEHILGAQGQVWTEYIKTPEQVEYMAYPRATALAEVVWLNQPEAERDYEGFLQRLKKQEQRFRFMDVNFRPQNNN